MKNDDIVTAAISRAKVRLAMLEEEKIAAYIQSLYKRFTDAYKRLNDAKAENSDQIDELQQCVNKLKQEIDDHRKRLKELKGNTAPTSSQSENSGDLNPDKDTGNQR